jgi:isocitrate lyase
MTPFDQEVRETREWLAGPRFAGIVRLYSARQVVEQRGTIAQDYTVAREAAAAFWERLRQLFAEHRAITTFGPYSPGQAVTLKRMGIEAIYLGGWATSAKGSTGEDPGPDLASYPLSQVPDEAAVIVRALLTADRNQRFQRARRSEAQRAATPEVDYRPFLIADADTGHGGEAHVRNLIRRFVEAGVTGYHIEDQRPGTKKCGHQGGKVLVSCDEQIKRLNAARFQLDVMAVPGIVVARTDAEAANLLDGHGDERDQPFVLGATNLALPSYKLCILALMKRLGELGAGEINGHLLYGVAEAEYRPAEAWLERTGLAALAAEGAAALRADGGAGAEAVLDRLSGRLVELWEDEAGLETFGEAVAEVIEFRAAEGEAFGLSAAEWREFARGASLPSALERARGRGGRRPRGGARAPPPAGG